MENMKGKIMNTQEFKAAVVCVVAFVLGCLIALGG
jgi:hypothetical protein